MAIPVGHVFQCVGIRHHDRISLALIVVVIADSRVDRRGVLAEALAAHPLVHVARSGQQLGDVDAAHGSAEQTDGAENGEPAAHVVWDFQKRQLRVFFFRDSVERTRGFAFLVGLEAGCDDDAVGQRLPWVPGFELVLDYEKLSGGLGRSPGLADDVEDRSLEPVAEPVEK